MNKRAGHHEIPTRAYTLTSFGSLYVAVVNIVGFMFFINGAIVPPVSALVIFANLPGSNTPAKLLLTSIFFLAFLFVGYFLVKYGLIFCACVAHEVKVSKGKISYRLFSKCYECDDDELRTVTKIIFQAVSLHSDGREAALLFIKYKKGPRKTFVVPLYVIRNREELERHYKSTFNAYAVKDYSMIP